MGVLQELGIELIQALQSLSPGLDSIMKFFTFLGVIEFYMIFITFLYWIVSPTLGFRVFMVLLTTDIFSTAFKQLLHQPRPYWVGDVKGMGIETSYGIPSSHASNSLSVWGTIAYQVRKRWFWITAVFIVLMISLSRLYLGVHFPHDVVGGWLVGLAILLIFIRYQDRAQAWYHTQSTGNIVIWGLGISIVFILIGIIVRFVIASSPDPGYWAIMSTEARTLNWYFTLAGAFFGSVAGYRLTRSHTPFLVSGNWIQKAGRYLVGMVGVLIFMYGLDALFSLIATDESILGYFLRYLRYGATTFWVMYGAPRLFLAVKLAAEDK